MKYYELKDDKEYPYQFIVTERGVGKTTSALKMVIENYWGGEAIWMRRSQVELDNFYGNIKYHWITKGIDIKYEKNQMVTVENNHRICTFIALSTCHNWKSGNFDNVNLIIFDEYISETGMYLKDEMKKMINFFQTIERERENVRIYFLSNAYSKNNPMFNYMEITKEDIERGWCNKNNVKIKFDFVKEWKDLTVQANNFSNLMSKLDPNLYDFMHKGAFSLDLIADACVMPEIKKMELTNLCYNIVVADFYCGVYEKNGNWYIKRILPTANAYRTTLMSGLFHSLPGNLPEDFYQWIFLKLINKECFLADYEIRDEVFRLLNIKLGNHYEW